MRAKLSTQAQPAPSADGDGNVIEETFEMELARYMFLDTTARVGLDSCPLGFGRNRKDFPRIKFMARAFLTIPATSVIPSEQAFSQGGETISKKRNRLLDESIEVLMILHSWLKVLKRIYWTHLYTAMSYFLTATLLLQYSTSHHIASSSSRTSRTSRQPGGQRHRHDDLEPLASSS